jgi:precorrin isomerase
MEHHLSYDEQNKIAVLVFKRNYNLADVKPIFESIRTMLEDKPYKQAIVTIDESISHSFQVENRETREATATELSKSNLSNVAFVGGSAAIRMIAKVLLKTGIIKINGDFFKTMGDATDWLKSKR